MSVAFRRDSDEEHLEPRFELPIPAGPNLVTAAGLAQAEAKVSELEQAAAAASDESVRAETLRSLRYWRTRLATAERAPPPPPGRVAFGTRVRFNLQGKERTIAIVGDDEAVPAEGRIAFSAPLVRAMLGAEMGDCADFGGAADAIEVLDIAPLETEA